MTRRFDSFPFEKYEKTPQGYLKLDGIVTRTGIFKYEDGNDYRSFEEVTKPESLKTMEMLPVTWEHPTTFDNRLDFLNPGNTPKYQKGFGSSKIDIIENGKEYLIKLSGIIITDPVLIDEIERPNSEYTQWSLGYDCKNVKEDGIFEGEVYNKSQKNIIYNHLAIVKSARCGDICSIVQKGDEDMSKKVDAACTCNAKKADSEEEKKEEMKETSSAATKDDIKEMMDSDERFSSLEKGHEKIIGMIESLVSKLESSSKKVEDSDTEKDAEKDEKKGDSILQTISNFNQKKIDSDFVVYDRDSFIKNHVVKNHI